MIAIVILIMFLFSVSFLNFKEHFYIIGEPTRNTRNMSYDLRGDPLVFFPQRNLFPFNNSELRFF
jgi:hypothetical protein